MHVSSGQSHRLRTGLIHQPAPLKLTDSHSTHDLIGLQVTVKKKSTKKNSIYWFYRRLCVGLLLDDSEGNQVVSAPC